MGTEADDWYFDFKANRDVNEIIAQTIKNGAEGAEEKMIKEAIKIIQDAVSVCETFHECQSMAINKYSKEWLDFIEIHRLERAERVANDIIRIIEKQANENKKQIKILDLGCGDAAVAATLAKRGYNMTCCDIEDYRLGEDAKKLPFIKIYSNSDFNFIDANSFDICLVLYVMHHMKQIDQTDLLHRIFKAQSFSQILIFEDAHPNLDIFADRDAILNNFLQIPPAALVPIPRSYHSVEDWIFTFQKRSQFCASQALPTYSLLEHGQPRSAKASICHFFHLVKENYDDDLIRTTDHFPLSTTSGVRVVSDSDQSEAGLL
mmetsp:Transcript_18868/g.28460  ORF Transcript_18868/g.28460 Transcript_18868/m.28460 type:complete len:319 (+) Transcript_18868:52-1008(+)